MAKRLRNGRRRDALHALALLRASRAFERRHFAACKTIEDQDLLIEIGYHQLAGTPLIQKQLFLIDIGSVATVQRRLRRLCSLGTVQKKACERDGRATEVALSPQTLDLFARYGEMLRANSL